MKKALVITSIYAPNLPLKKFANLCHEKNIHFYLIGDTKTPENFELAHCDYWSIEKQKHLSFALSGKLPFASYSRKNLGYLLAIQNGADLIFESDDDNFPLDNFFANKRLMHDVPLSENHGWINVFKYFTAENVWPRGFPLGEIKNSSPAFDDLAKHPSYCPIQHGLSNDNPDVDAIYRLTQPLPVKFKRGSSVAVGNGSWCPFNTQSTAFFSAAFPLLYLPSTCNARLTDIWRGFIAARILWANQWAVLFTEPTVYQDRNAHDLMVDFKLEVDGYLHNDKLCKTLAALNLKSGEDGIEENMFQCYETMIALGLIQPSELKLLECWFMDLALIRNQSKRLA